MKMLDTIKEKYKQLQASNGSSVLTPIEQSAFHAFNKMGIPTVKHEEWKYTRISGLLNKEFQFPSNPETTTLSKVDIDPIRLPGYEQANELVFVNGFFSFSLSVIRSQDLVVLPL